VLFVYVTELNSFEREPVEYNMTVHHESEPKLYRYSRIVCGVSTHVLCAVFTGFITVLAKPGSSEYNKH